MKTLLLPGMDGTGRLFAPLERHLPAELSARVVRYPTHQVCTYNELLEALPLPSGRFAVVAESFSGPLAIRLAARHPSNVRALVLIATFVQCPSKLLRWLSPLTRLFARAPLSDFALRQAMLGADASDDEVTELRAAIRSVAPSVLATRLREVSAVDIREELSALTLPMLYLAGSHDRLVGKRVMSQLKRLKPEMECQIIEAPHLVLQRRPHEAARAITAFLRGI